MSTIVSASAAPISTSAAPSTICSATSVPAMAAVPTSAPRAFIWRRSTAMRATSPSRATSTVLNRKPMNTLGSSWRVLVRGAAGTALTARPHTAAFSHTDTRLASIASTSVPAATAASASTTPEACPAKR